MRARLFPGVGEYTVNNSSLLTLAADDSVRQIYRGELDSLTFAGKSRALLGDRKTSHTFERVYLMGRDRMCTTIVTSLLLGGLI